MTVHMSAEAPPRSLARITGAFYLLTTVAAIFADVVVRGNLVVGNDAAATAHNILASQSLYRWGFAADLVADAAYVVVTLLLYELLRPVNKRLSLLAAFMSLVGCAVGVGAALFHFAPVLLLGGPAYLNAFSAAQLQALSLFALKMHAVAFNTSLVFFGFYCLMLGYLIFRSRYLPWAIGALMAMAGLSLLTNSFAFLLSPALYQALPDALGYIDLAGEASLTVWLLVAGVNVAQWERRAVTAPT